MLHSVIKHSFFLIILYCLTTICAIPSERDSTLKCNYDNCPAYDPNKLNIHLVPHSHDDVGWLKTVDQYYYGSAPNKQGYSLTNIQQSNYGVQYIFDSVIQSLRDNPNRRYIQVETAFLMMWWKEQTDELREVVKQLVNEGRLEFISGAWSMNDEATPYYNQIIDQFTWGFRQLKDTFGTCGIPKIGWQIDPFGHSREQASIFAQMKFDGMFFWRFDFDDRDVRYLNKTMELMWKGSDDLGTDSDLFTGVLNISYSSPPNFCYEILGCDESPWINDTESDEYNVPQLVDLFIEYSHNYSEHYATNNIMYTMGMDFNYQAGLKWFKQIDNLIKYVSERNDPTINVFYSTPSCYLYSIYQSGLRLTTKSDDFFPNAPDHHSYWVGYFTSRPTLKYYDRVGNSYLQMCKQLSVIAQLDSDYDRQLYKLREAMGYMQHHDAITGTEQQHVANDYSRQLSKGVEKCKIVTQAAYDILMPYHEEHDHFSTRHTALTQVFCDSLNISACAITESNAKVAVTFYNPIGRQMTHIMHIPVASVSGYLVFDSALNAVNSSLVNITETVQNIPDRKNFGNATRELVFAVTLPALGYATYFIEQSSAANNTIATKTDITGPFQLEGNGFHANFDNQGRLLSVTLANNVVIAVSQQYMYYIGHDGNNTAPELRASGAYIFRPVEQNPQPIALTNSALVSYDNVDEVWQDFTGNWISQVIRVSKLENFIEFEWFVGPIPIDDNNGKEIITRVQTNFTTNRVFYTDANGRQILRRVYDYRPTWNYTGEEPVAGNYYPVNSRIFIRDETQGLQLTLVNDRSQGGGSITPDSLELMVHRRTLFDDDLGVVEPLNETIDGVGLVVRGKHWLFVASINESAEIHRPFVQNHYLSPIASFATYNTTIQEYSNDYNTNYSALHTALPPNVHLLTLEQWSNGQYLLRLEHFYQNNESSNYSRAVTVDLAQLFHGFQIVRADEMSLGANQGIDDYKRLDFALADIEEKPRRDYKRGEFNAEALTVTLNPMEIRTFLISTENESSKAAINAINNLILLSMLVSLFYVIMEF